MQNKDPMAEIELTRPTGYKTDRLRAYQICLDNEKVEQIKPGETKVFTLLPGRYELQLKQDWASSEKLQVHLGDDERARFVCAPRVKENNVNFATGLRMIYWSTLGCRRYIDLRHGAVVGDEPEGWMHRVNGLALFGIAFLIGIALWLPTGKSIGVVGIVVAGMAVAIAGLVARWIGTATVRATEDVQRRRDD